MKTIMEKAQDLASCCNFRVAVHMLDKVEQKMYEFDSSGNLAQFMVDWSQFSGPKVLLKWKTEVQLRFIAML